ncbi:MAG: tRNA modification GTPase [Phycisphaerae bacterium]|nr:tRNA modification GTPase [Phycisphaerae bacterium]
MFDVLDDTIVAVSSPPGQGFRGIVRISGPRAVGIAGGLFADADATPLSQRGGFRRFCGEVRIEGDASVPAELYLFRAPRSYTRQDLVEFHTIGSPPVLAMLLERIIEGGARAAEAGEFTARAFFNGAMSLNEAEAVAALIGAQSDAQLRSAHRLREQAPARQVQAWMRQLTELCALVEADIDFAEEPIEFITPANLRDRLTALRAELDKLIHDAKGSERFETLPTVLLIGPANAGKSSLMNALSQTDRAICSAVAGTTRDILTAPMSLPSMDCLLLDGVGLTHTDDELIQLAQSLTKTAVSRVDLLCLVVDVSVEHRNKDLEILRDHRRQRAVIAANKCDLMDVDKCAARVAQLRRAKLGPVQTTSAASGAGLEKLKSAIQDRLCEDQQHGQEHTILPGARLQSAITAASAALGRAGRQACGMGETIDRAELIALELREALDALSVICGVVTTEDLLARVFADFCIGK